MAGLRRTHLSLAGSVTRIVAAAEAGEPPLLTASVTVSVPLFSALVRPS